MTSPTPPCFLGFLLPKEQLLAGVKHDPYRTLSHVAAGALLLVSTFTANGTELFASLVMRQENIQLSCLDHTTDDQSIATALHRHSCRAPNPIFQSKHPKLRSRCFLGTACSGNVSC